MNRAVLWHLQLCLRLADRLGYHFVAVHIATAIDALEQTAASEEEIVRMDLGREERVRLILEIFEKHGKSNQQEDDSTDAE